MERQRRRPINVTTDATVAHATPYFGENEHYIAEKQFPVLMQYVRSSTKKC